MSRRTTKILSIVSDPPVRRTVAALFRQFLENPEIHEVPDAVAFAEVPAVESFDYALLDEKLTWAEPVDVLLMLRRRCPGSRVVILSSNLTVESYRAWIRRGASDVAEATLAGMSAFFDDLPSLSENTTPREAKARVSPSPDLEKPKAPPASPPRTMERTPRPTVETGIGSFLLSGDGRILETDKIFPGLLGYDSAERMKGMRLQSLCDAASESALRELIVPSTPCPRSIHATFMDVAGKTVNLGLRRTSLRGDGAGRVRGIAWLETGERHGKSAERMSASVEADKARLSDYTHLVAHEIRTPIENLRRIARLILMEHKRQLGTDGEELLGQLISGANDASRVVGELLSLAELGNTEKLNGGPHELSTILDDVQRELQPEISNTEAEIVRHGNAFIQGDGTALRLLFRNLIENAIKFRGDTPPLIEIAAKRDGDGWLVTVADDGIGIPEESRERVLKPFVRLHPRSRYPGTGLGLSLCDRIARLHGSRLQFFDRPGGGIAISLNLPSAGTLQSELSPEAVPPGEPEKTFET